MKEMRENDFDRLFKEKSQQVNVDFEEDAWNLMEKKLRNRDRFILFRNSATIILLFLLAGSAFFVFRGQEQTMLVKKDLEARKEHSMREIKKPLEEESITANIKKNEVKKAGFSPTDERKQNDQHIGNHASNKTFPKNTVSPNKNHNEYTNTKRLVKQDLETLPYLKPRLDEGRLAGWIQAFREPFETRDSISQSDKKKLRLPQRPSYSFTFSAGPDFSSTSSLAGAQGSLNLGLLLNAGIKRFTLSTGFRYGVKNYKAETYDYQLKNPSRAALISGIDASCNVLEIPLQASYTLSPRLSLNAALSSYLMLKEKYRFVYRPESGLKDYVLEKNNENKSILGVTGFSLMYRFKPLKNGLELGIEPYVKLPLSGVGEGKVKLKSSGVTLNMTYDLFKNH